MIVHAKFDIHVHLIAEWDNFGADGQAVHRREAARDLAGLVLRVPVRVAAAWMC